MPSSAYARVGSHTHSGPDTGRVENLLVRLRRDLSQRPRQDLPTPTTTLLFERHPETRGGNYFPRSSGGGVVGWGVGVVGFVGNKVGYGGDQDAPLTRLV